MSAASANGSRSIAGSYVVFEAGVTGDQCFIPGQAQQFLFHTETFTSDNEYVYELWLEFPDGWAVDSVSVYRSPFCDNGSFCCMAFEVQDPPNTVKIYHPRFQALNDHCTASYLVRVTPDYYPGDAPVSWYWNGDGYGNQPHHPCSNDGYTPAGQIPCDEMVSPPALIPFCSEDPAIYLLPVSQTGKGCPGSSYPYKLNLVNLTGGSNSFSINYDVTTANATVTGPRSVTLGDGENVTLTAWLSPQESLVNGETVSVEIAVSGGCCQAEAVITLEMTGWGWQNISSEPNCGRMDNVAVAYDQRIWSIAGYGYNHDVRVYDPWTDEWESIPGSAFPFVNYARSGAVSGHKAYLYGDATGTYSGLWSYDLEMNTWLQEHPSGVPPAQSGIWAPAWVVDEETGLLYLTGGATTPGGGNLATVYVYDPANNTWLAPLPDFSNPRNFHAAFIYRDRNNGHKMLAVAGGINDSGEGLASTQCYDLDARSWHDENADMPELPGEWWGMGYAHSRIGLSHYLWLVGGTLDGVITGRSAYYYVSAGQWYNGEDYHNTEVYRTSAVALGNEVYKLGGSAGAFRHTGLACRHFVCDAVAIPLSGWALGLGMLLILAFTAYRMRKIY